jgi:Flp pilus assembly protein TadB
VRFLQWPGPDGAKRSKHPYRDAAVVYAGFAIIIVVAAFLTGGNLERAVVTAVFVYVVATAWTWFQLRRRRAKEEAE